MSSGINDYIYPADPIFIDFGRLPAWNCPMDEDTESNEIPEGPSVTSHHNTNDPDDLESEPSYNLRRKFKGKYLFRKMFSRPSLWTSVNYHRGFFDYILLEFNKSASDKLYQLNICRQAEKSGQEASCENSR